MSLEPLSACDIAFQEGNGKKHFVIDQKLFSLYPDLFLPLQAGRRVLSISAEEKNKTLDRFTNYAERLMEQGLRRDHILVAVGGGIIQDITCFLASILFRGMKWSFFPTTLLAQADSCIGSKSSVNVGRVKNLVGTFYPPEKVTICTEFLRTLERRDILSGIGEMIKVHIIAGKNDFLKIAQFYEKILEDSQVLERFILRSLEIKKKLIEQDEFDQSIRNIMNYGHSFGHAIEAATDFRVPHGVGVTLGIDFANYVSFRLGRIEEREFSEMHLLLKKNFSLFQDVEVPMDPFLVALSKDKKNVDTRLVLILPKKGGGVEKVTVAQDSKFVSLCHDYLNEGKWM